MSPEISAKIERFFEKYKLERLDKGQIVVLASEEPRGVYYLVSGQIRQYMIGTAGNEVVANIFKPPAFFPMSWALNKTPNEYFFKATTRTLVKCAPANEAVKFLQDNPDIALDLLRRVYRGTDGLLGRVMHLMGGSAKNRLLYELLIYSVRFGKNREGGSICLEITEQEMASLLGTTRETVNREMGKLKSSELVKVERNCIIIPDLDKIRAAIGDNL